MHCYKLDTYNSGNDEIIFVDSLSEAEEAITELALSLGFTQVPEGWEIMEWPGFDVGTKGIDASWDDFGSFASENECIAEIKDSIEKQFDDFFVDDNDCVIFGISKEGDRRHRIFKCYRDTIIEETPEGVIVGEVNLDKEELEAFDNGKA